MITRYIKTIEGYINKLGAEIHEVECEDCEAVELPCTEQEYTEYLYAELCAGKYIVTNGALELNPDYIPE